MAIEKCQECKEPFEVSEHQLAILQQKKRNLLLVRIVDIQFKERVMDGGMSEL